MTDKMRKITLILMSVLLTRTVVTSAVSPLAVGDYILRSCVSSVVLRNYRRIPASSDSRVDSGAWLTPGRQVPTLDSVKNSVKRRQEGKIDSETPVWTLSIKKDRKSLPATFVRKNLYLEPPPGGSYSAIKSRNPEIFVIKSRN